MNGITLFELIGQADEQMLEQSEWTAAERGYGFNIKKASVLIAAAVSVLAITLTISAFEGVNFLNLIFGSLSQDAEYPPDENVIEAQINEGQWVYLNGDNIAVILPESPVKILISGDGGATWKESVVLNSDSMEIYGELRDDFRYHGGFIGLFGEKGGYLVLTCAVSMNNQPMRIYLTADGGDTWLEIGNPYSSDTHISVLTGAGFSTPEIGFISYRYYEDSGPDIWWTSDGGDTWQRLTVALPEPYNLDEYRFTPQSPTFDDEKGVYPIVALHDGNAETIYMYTHDYGLTWTFEE